MSKIAIKAENISKQYRLGEIGTGTISQDLNRWWHKVRGKEDPFLKIGESNDRSQKGETDFVWSLKDINFEINQGDTVGIIGRNGAGKSTLLKLLSKVTKPTTGQFKVNGRIASLLEVGTGFHPEMTGRENIYLNGAILGMRRSEITRKFDEIVDFAGIERYIDTPVKRYSSGMYVRLAFAVAAHLESEILIVDEVLAVGDAEFQKKSLSKLDDINTKQDKTVLFVTHNTQLIQNLCKKAILLEDGILKEFGDVNTVVRNYTNNKQSNKSIWNGQKGDDIINIIQTSINENSIFDEIKTSEALQIKIIAEIKSKVDLVDFSIIINSAFNYPILTSVFNDYSDTNGIDEGVHEIIFEIPPYTLGPGAYYIEFRIGYPYIKKLDTSQCDLNFELTSESQLGNRYFASNSPLFNSIVRPNYFKEINKLS
jgi:lipopolysaccharide transport system ATP-binding protein